MEFKKVKNIIIIFIVLLVFILITKGFHGMISSPLFQAMKDAMGTAASVATWAVDHWELFAIGWLITAVGPMLGKGYLYLKKNREAYKGKTKNDKFRKELEEKYGENWEDILKAKDTKIKNDIIDSDGSLSPDEREVAKKANVSELAKDLGKTEEEAEEDMENSEEDFHPEE